MNLDPRTYTDAITLIDEINQSGDFNAMFMHGLASIFGAIPEAKSKAAAVRAIREHLAHLVTAEGKAAAGQAFRDAWDIAYYG